jgi:hypothetical protein
VLRSQIEAVIVAVNVTLGQRSLNVLAPLGLQVLQMKLGVPRVEAIVFEPLGLMLPVRADHERAPVRLALVRAYVEVSFTKHITVVTWLVINPAMTPDLERGVMRHELPTNCHQDQDRNERSHRIVLTAKRRVEQLEGRIYSANCCSIATARPTESRDCLRSPTCSSW